MEYGICNLAIVPLRAEPSSRAEMVSQILFGEVFEIMERKDEWIRIITTLDGYEGWLNYLQYISLSPAAYKKHQQKKVPLTYRPVTQAWKTADNSVVYLPVASSLSFLEGTICHIGSEYFEIIGEIGAKEDIADTAKSFLNAPYLWGGRTHMGIDCSGFVQAVYRLQGIILKRDAYLQAEQGQTVDFLQSAKLGDLAFFDNGQGHIIHVGMMLNNSQIIHASGRVKIDKIDDQGIFSGDLQKYTHKLRIIKRLL